MQTNAKPNTSAPAAVAPEMQAAADQAAKDLANPKSAPALNATQAGTLGLGGTAHVVPTDAEVAKATTPYDPTTDVDTGLKNKDIQPPILPHPDVTPPQTVMAEPTKAIGPVVGQAVGSVSPSAGPAPGSVKDIVSSIVADHAKTSPPGESWQDFAKGAIGKVGEFLQRWGLNEMGAPGVQTKGEIQQAQQFELAKAEKLAQIQQAAMGLENQYQTQRMQLQQQMNQTNMTAQGKIELQNRISELDREHQNRIAEFGPEFEQARRIAGLSPGAQPGTFWGRGK